MTGEDGGIRAAAARFSSEVDSALTRARRAADEAKAQSAENRRATAELTEQAKTGRLRGAHRGEVAPTAAEPAAEAAEFRAANGLPVPALPAADELLDRLPPAPADEPPPEPDYEDFSEHQVMIDAAEHDESKPEPEPESQPSGIDSPDNAATRSSDDDDDFSQQRILFDTAEEPYVPAVFDGAVFVPKDEENPS